MLGAMHPHAAARLFWDNDADLLRIRNLDSTFRLPFVIFALTSCNLGNVYFASKDDSKPGSPLKTVTRLRRGLSRSKKSRY